MIGSEDVSALNNTLVTGRRKTDTDKLAKLLDLAEITTAINADHGHTSTTNDTSQMIRLSPLPMARRTQMMMRW